MTIKQVFKSTISSLNFVFSDGMVLPFIGGRMEVDNPKYARELRNEISVVGKGKSKHPHIYIDENEQEIDTEALDPMEQIRKRAREEALEQVRKEQAAALSPNNISTSVQGPLSASVASSANIAQAVNSDSGSEASTSVEAAKQADPNTPIVVPQLGQDNPVTMSVAELMAQRKAAGK